VTAPARDRSLLRHPDFLKLWSAETISQFGDQVTFLAIPLVAILFLGSTPFEVALIGTVEFLPFILFTLPAGVWVDRLRRRPILIGADLLRAISLLSIPLAYELGVLTIWQLYAVAFANGVCKVFFDVAYQSYLPAIVDKDQLVDGNSKLEISRSAGQIAGPSVAGILIGYLTAPIAVIVDAISFLGSALFVSAIRRREPPPDRHVDEHGRPHESMRTQIASGLRYVLGHRYLRNIAASTGISNLFSNIMFSIFLVYAVRQLAMSEALIGLTFGLGNIGFLVGAFVAGPLANRIGVGRAIVLGAIVIVPAVFLVPLAPREFPVPFLVASGALSGLGIAIYNINQVSLRQAITPERMQGRMNATMRFIVWGTIPVGQILGGVIGTAVSLSAALWVGAFGSIIAVLPLVFSSLPRLRRIEDAIEVDPEPAPLEAPPAS
jgi:MFS family permease